MIRVLLADDDRLVRSGLRALLDAESDITVVGEAADGREAIDRARTTQPDVVLMDLNLGIGPSGAATTSVLRALDPPPAVLVLTTYVTEADILAALDAGAGGYLLKDAPPEELFRAVRAVARGETVLASEVAAVLVRRVHSPRPALTEREVQILGLLADGLGNKEMARRLLVSEATVKTYVSRILDKLDCANRVQIALLTHDAELT